MTFSIESKLVLRVSLRIRKFRQSLFGPFILHCFVDVPQLLVLKEA